MKFKVVKGEIGGFGGRIFKAGEVVTEKNFPIGNAEQLAEMGFLEVVKDEVETIDINKLNKDGIIAELTKFEIEHDPAAAKAVLLDLLKSSIEQDNEEI